MNPTAILVGLVLGVIVGSALFVVMARKASRELDRYERDSRQSARFSEAVERKS